MIRFAPGTTFVLLLSVVLSLGLVTPRLGAQAVCSAPHSSPGLSGSGSLRTLPPGSGWIQLSGYVQEADTRFTFEGERETFFSSGAASTRSLYLTAAVGVVWGLDVWAQASLHRLRYSDDSGSRDRTGLGDVRLAARAGAELVGLDLPVSLRAGVKLPGSRFPVDVTVLPLSEGQVDAEVSVESGHAFAGGAFYVLGWVGHRWRLGISEAERNPGDEWFGHVAAGGARGSLRWELAVEGLFGAPPVQQGIELVTDRRRLVQVVPGVAWQVGPGEADLGVQVPLAGRNLPSDPSVALGYRLSW